MTDAEIDPSKGGRVVGRYVLFDELASGGMATVHLGRVVGAAGFSRTVAIKRLHPHFAKDPDFRAMILDEARIVSRIQHTHVIPTIDVVEEGEDVLLVMEYVHGEPASRLMRAARITGKRLPAYVVITIVAQALYGLHAAHEARDDHGQPLNVVHRDVSPQNILVGVDGVTRVLDFGVAKAAGRIQSTRDGALKGKLPYMPPEQIRGQSVDRRTDIYAASVVLWEMLVGRPLFRGDNDAATMHAVLEGPVPLPSSIVPLVGHDLDAIVMRGLARDPAKRYATALEMAEALHRIGMATGGEVSALVRQLGAEKLEQRGRRVAEIESRTIVLAPKAVSTPPPPLPASPLPPEVRAPLPSSLEPTLVRSPVVVEPIAALAAPKSQTRTMVLTAGAIVILGGTLAMGWYLGTRNSEDAARPANAAPLPSAAPSAAMLAPSSVTPVAQPPTPQPSVTTVASAAPTAVAPRATMSPRPAKSSPKAPKPIGPNCNPPYTVDDDGIRIPKPECL